MEGKTDGGRWLIAEDSDKTIRSMAKPSSMGKDYPEHYNQYSIVGKDYDRGAVHYNCTIFEHAVYKMMTSDLTKSIKPNMWAKVYFNSLFRLTTTSTFLDASYAVLDAARNLGFTFDECKAIKKAFYEVGIIKAPSIQITLEWGKNPRDLDSHLIGPSSDGNDKFHVFYGSKIYKKGLDADGKTLYGANLDYDVTSGTGPEITSIHDLALGDYYFYVHDFSNRAVTNSTALASSEELKVTIKKNMIPIAEFYLVGEDIL